MNILFICTANRDRSRTAEHFFQEKYPKFNFYSAGIDEALCSKSKGRFVDYQICDYADRIVCMEQRHAQFILDLFGDAMLDKLEILEVDDKEDYMSITLVKELQHKFKI